MQPFLFIFGTSPKVTVLDTGDFYCPTCETQRRYEHQLVRNYFTAYFVPVFPLGSGDERISCLHCQRHYTLDVLNTSVKLKRKPKPLAQQLNSLADDLYTGKSVEYAVADLSAAGLERELAEQYVQQAIGAVRLACPTCGLHYAQGVERCPEDNSPL